MSQSETPSVEKITSALVHPSIMPYSNPSTSSILPILEPPLYHALFVNTTQHLKWLALEKTVNHQNICL